MTLQRMSHAGAAPLTGVAVGFNATAMSFSIVSATGYPTGSGGPFVLKIDAGVTGSEEKILCSSISGTTVTVAPSGRGYDNTVATTHGVGTVNVEHDFAAIEADDANDHIYTTTRDDHTQYARTDGTRLITGAQTFNNNITVNQSATISGNATVTGSLTVGGVTTAALGGATDTAWTAISSFSNSWANVGGADMTAGYRKLDGRVYLRGIITKASWSGVAFTLPIGYHPSATVSPGTINLNGQASWITVDSSGNVTPSNGTSGAIDLSVVSFDTL